MKKFFVLTAFLFLSSIPVFASDYRSEVMHLEGTAFVTSRGSAKEPVREGDILKPGDVLEVGPKSSVDLAYDGEWNNVTTLDENSKVKIESIYPTVLYTDNGSIFAKLKSLPKGTTFEVKTPVNVAAVRGTIYQTTYRGGKASVYNYSSSPVEVFGLDSKGKRLKSPVVLRSHQKTFIPEKGLRPAAPARMAPGEHRFARSLNAKMEKQLQNLRSKGRMGKVQTVKYVENARTLNASSVSKAAKSKKSKPKVSKKKKTAKKPAKKRARVRGRL